MAINLVTGPNALPLTTADYQAQNNLTATGFLNHNDPIEIGTGVVNKGASFNIGGAIYLADADTTITGTTSDYVRIVPSGATASANYVVDLTGVTWNSTYNAYEDVSGNIYVFDEALAIVNGELSTNKTKFGNANPSFNDITYTGNITVPTSPTSGSESISSGTTWIPPNGIYNFIPATGNPFLIQIYAGGSWRDPGERINGSTVFCDGSNVRIRSTSATASTVYYLKF